MKMKQMAAMAVITASASLAHAADTDWGQHGALEVGGGFALGAGQQIFDTFSFTLSGASKMLAVAVSNDGGAFNLIEGEVRLYQGKDLGGEFALGSFTFDAAAVSHSFGKLAAGDYHYLVMGRVAFDAAAASYQLNSQLAPVPEPQTYALLLAGLFGIGLMAKRRRSAH